MYDVMSAATPPTRATERSRARIVVRSAPASVPTNTTPSVIAAMYA